MKGDMAIHLKKLYAKMFSAKIGWNWLSGSDETSKMLKANRQTPT